MTDAAAPMNPRGSPRRTPRSNPGSSRKRPTNPAAARATTRTLLLPSRRTPRRASESGSCPTGPPGRRAAAGLLSRRRTKNSTKISTTSTRVTSTLSMTRPGRCTPRRAQIAPTIPSTTIWLTRRTRARGRPGAEEDARTGLIDAYSDDDDERDEVISVTATIIDGDMSAEDGNDGSDDDDPDAEACPWSYLDLRRDFYAEVRFACKSPPLPRLALDPRPSNPPRFHPPA